MTLSRFRAMPRQGHLDGFKRIHGCLSKMRHATIEIRTDTPDHSNIPVKLHDWEHSCCADAKEEIPLEGTNMSQLRDAIRPCVHVSMKMVC